MNSPLKDRFAKSFNSKAFHYYCPLCQVKRTAPLHPNVNQPIHFIRMSLTSLMFTLLAWPWFGWKGIVSFVPIWIIFEFYFRSKVKSSLECDVCGFDPFLYSQDLAKAKSNVQAKLKESYAKKGFEYPVASTKVDKNNAAPVLTRFEKNDSESGHESEL